jgi:hypothetical protein
VAAVDDGEGLLARHDDRGMTAVLSGRVDEVADLAKTNLWR